ncbi:MAG: tetratricopeptide repeat protein, partial [Planctomycetaceae bacterium]|nr:tetratricopeptide repeat protein [Planctomycetaceae bacterium]
MKIGVEELCAYVAGSDMDEELRWRINDEKQDPESPVSQWLTSFYHKCEDPLAVDWQQLFTMCLATESTEDQEFSDGDEAALNEVDQYVSRGEELIRQERRREAADILSEVYARLSELPVSPAEYAVRLRDRIARGLERCQHQSANAIYKEVVKLAIEYAIPPQAFLRRAFFFSASDAISSLQYREAIPHLQFALQTCLENTVTDKADAIYSSSQLCVCYQRIAEHELAVESGRKAIDVFQSTEHPPERSIRQIVDCCAVMGEANFAIGRFADAHYWSHEVVRYVIDTGNGPVLTDALTSLGVAALMAEDFDSATNAFNRILRVDCDDLGETSRRSCIAANGLLAVSIAKGNIAEAFDVLDKAEDVYHRLPLPHRDLWILTLNNKASVYFEAGNLTASESALQEAMNYDDR